MTDQDFAARLSSAGTLAIPYEDALRAIDDLTRRGMRVERWEGLIVMADGTRAASLLFGGSFALSRDPARAASVASAAIKRASEEWKRKPEFEGARLEFVLTFGKA